MTQRKIKHIDGGSPEYWRQRTEGFRLIHQAERAYARVQPAPQYKSGGYDEDGDVIPIENLGPWDDMGAAIEALEANETAVDILVAQRRTHLGTWPIDAVIRELAASRDPTTWLTELQARGGTCRLSRLSNLLTACGLRAGARS